MHLLGKNLMSASAILRLETIYFYAKMPRGAILPYVSVNDVKREEREKKNRRNEIDSSRSAAASITAILISWTDGA